MHLIKTKNEFLREEDHFDGKKRFSSNVDVQMSDSAE